MISREGRKDVGTKQGTIVAKPHVEPRENLKKRKGEGGLMEKNSCFSGGETPPRRNKFVSS